MGTPKSDLFVIFQCFGSRVAPRLPGGSIWDRKLVFLGSFRCAPRLPRRFFWLPNLCFKVFFKYMSMVYYPYVKQYLM